VFHLLNVGKGELTMLFKPYLAEAILQGKKTQTRRLPSNTGSVLFQGHIIAVYQNHRLRWRVRKTYAIQPGRGKKAIGRFRLLSIRHERLQDITEDDTAAEGISRRPGPYIFDFARLWDSINTKPSTQWEDNPQVFVLTFELVTK
jgi:hypothetical protein